MLIALLASDKDLALSGQDVVRLFFPEARIAMENQAAADLKLFVAATQAGGILYGNAILEAGNLRLSEEAHTGTVPVIGDERNQQKRLVKLALFRLLNRYTGNPPGPWGILTGIRPTKIVHRLLDLGWDPAGIQDYLITGYDLDPGKAATLIDIAARQRKYLLSAEQAGQMVSIYIGIPFCPSRCAYCSFPSCSVEAGGALLVHPFVRALKREISEIGSFLKASGKNVQAVYVGGGTPTVLSESQLDEVLGFIREYLTDQNTVEITLEAGRPDTITVEKLKLAKQAGVNRLSINPQSMNLSTLRIIGRHHTPRQVEEAVETARGIGFATINMDIIAGLPGESIAHVEHTLQEVGRLDPENLTVHTLAVKRASKLKEARLEFALPDSGTVSRMLELTAKLAGDLHMHPYYLYRQKLMVGPFENIGYAREGHDSIYNIQMIEERQTVLGLGGGAGSKFVEPGTWYLTSHYNPKDPQVYMERIDELITKKILMLERYLPQPI